MPELSDIAGPAKAIAEQLEETGMAAELVDAEWRLVWVSPEMRAIAEDDSDEGLGIGRHYLETRQLPAWSQFISEIGARDWAREFGPFMAGATPGGVGALQEMAGDLFGEVFDGVEPATQPALHCMELEFRQPGYPPASVNFTAMRLCDEEGQVAGTLLLYASRLPATVLALVTRGDEAMFARMAELAEPAPRPTAILFADLEASGALSRRLASAAYFRLLRALTTAIDGAVTSECGIVGKHVGDGVTALFLADQLGSDSAAALAALRTARRLPTLAAEATAELEADGVEVEAAECRLNVAVHWSGGLYVGQVVTGGRLEVTALGDEVNECARIEQSATGGVILASKGVIERLAPDDAAQVGLEPATIRYRPLADLDDAGEKALRDAGTIAVTSIEEEPQNVD
jgi:class 3 adenylate cyclase